MSPSQIVRAEAAATLDALVWSAADVGGAFWVALTSDALVPLAGLVAVGAAALWKVGRSLDAEPPRRSSAPARASLRHTPSLVP